MPHPTSHPIHRRHAMPRGLTGATLLLLLTGCVAVGPDYAPPVANAPAGWHSATEQAGIAVTATSPAALSNWWTVFNDPVLTGLMQKAATGNTDLRQAMARVREARARQGISRADRLPALTASGAASSSKGSEEVGSGASRELFSAGFDAVWELDLFGGKRRAEEAAAADLEASEADLRDVLVSLLAEVARNYLEVRTLQTRLAIAAENLQAREETASLTRLRLESGLIAEIEMEQAVTSLEQTRAQIPALEADLGQAANRLAVLMGEQPGSLTTLLADRRPIPTAPERLVIGIPAEVLNHRPDVRRAERQLAAQTARIGEATAALYPDLTLTGSIGLEALAATRLFNSSARTGSARAGLNWSLFDFGAIRRNIEVQSARQEQALGNYEGTILTALAEVENSLTAYDREQRRHLALTRAEAAAANGFAMARQQYEAGMIPFLTLLDSQRSLLAVQDQVATSNSAITAHLIALYKALGGGWTSPAAPTETDQQE